MRNDITNMLPPQQNLAKVIFFTSLFLLTLLLISRPLLIWCGGGDLFKSVIASETIEGISPQLLNSNPDKTDITFDFKTDTIQKGALLFQMGKKDNGIKIYLTQVVRKKTDSLAKSSPILDSFYTQINIKDKIATLSTLFYYLPGQWHHLNVRAQNGQSVSITLDGLLIAQAFDSGIHYDVHPIQLGPDITLSNPRVFQGEIRNFKLTNIIFDHKKEERLNKIKNLVMCILLYLCCASFFKLSKQTMLSLSKLHYISFAVLIGFFVAALTFYISVGYFGYQPQGFWFIPYWPYAQFNDFYDNLVLGSFLDPYFSPYYDASQYFPFAYLLLYPFHWINSNLALVIDYVIFVIVFLWWSSGAIQTLVVNNGLAVIEKWRSLCILIFMSFPFWEAFERGNIETILFVFVLGFVYCYQQNNIKWAVIFLIMAIAMKIYPIFFLALLWKDKHYKALLFAVIGVLGLELVSLFCFHHSIVQNLDKIIQTGFNSGADKFAASLTSENMSTNILALIKIAVWYFFPHFYFNSICIFFYWFICLFITLITFAYFMYVEEVRWKQYVLLISLMLLLPPISYDYKLLYLYIPLMFFIQSPAAEYDLCYATIFAGLLLIKNTILLTFNVGISSIIDPILLFCMMGLIFYQGLRRKQLIFWG